MLLSAETHFFYMQLLYGSFWKELQIKNDMNKSQINTQRDQL